METRHADFGRGLKQQGSGGRLQVWNGHKRQRNPKVYGGGGRVGAHGYTKRLGAALRASEGTIQEPGRTPQSRVRFLRM